MRIKSIFVAVVLLVSISICAAKSIGSIVVDKAHGNVYVAEILDNPYLYEIDDSTLTQTAASPFSSDSVEVFSLGKKGNELYSLLEIDPSSATDFTLATYGLNIHDGKVLTATQTADIGPISSWSIDYQFVSANDNFVIGQLQTNITLINLSTLKQVDSITAWPESNRRTPVEGKNVIYNPDNDRVIVFFSLITGDDWGVQVKEFHISSGSFVEKRTKFNPENAIGLIFNYCDIDNDAVEIWCYAANSQEFWIFDADDLSSYTIFSVDTISSNVLSMIYDFDEDRVFAWDLNSTASTFVLKAIDLDSGAIIATYETALAVLSETAALDANAGQLYVAVMNSDDSVAPQVAVFNTENLHLRKTITLSHD